MDQGASASETACAHSWGQQAIAEIHHEEPHERGSRAQTCAKCVGGVSSPSDVHLATRGFTCEWLCFAFLWLSLASECAYVFCALLL